MKSILLYQNPALNMTKDNHRTRIRDDIRARLLTGQIGPGDRLIDHAIAAELGVSRMPVREALMQLVSEGYLTSTSRGFALPDLTPTQIAEVFTLRKLLEPHAAALAAQSLDAAALMTLTQALADLHQAADIAAFHRAAEAFRNTWAGALPNQALRETIQRYSAQIQTVRLATMKDPMARQTIASGLSALLGAFAARDALAAHDLMTRFIHQAEDSLHTQRAPQ
ncbi:GntR family transcriptional regulator [Rhodobacter sp. KR11]|uniref:GntR family transcriptional regulator n=1 Tax=Rhodobacter sp. KR11 TaxID=2974588 RepID=UPI0022234C32|nr:GntR family transcriptional regulator [Rhodobacter sp. KR11]MCW1918732.1 GntR family transcriptional regulator [Rhodobacter sp. KR11]